MGTSPPPQTLEYRCDRKSERTWLGHLICGVIVLYQRGVSPFLGHRCRFIPSCSSYAREAIDVWGVRRGLWLILKRLGACHPWGRSGYDPVPTPKAQE